MALIDKAQTVPSQTAAPKALPIKLREVLGYLTDQEIADIERAYLFSAKAHAGQLRLSGEAYISHPLEVAKISAELGLDSATVIACLLHDVLEDTSLSKQEIEQMFGKDVVDIVDGVSKITHLGTENREIAQAKSFQKMLLAMTKDLRVILVKLADRLHNMRTLRYQTSQKRLQTAKETLEIYAPIAQRLGMEKVCYELENLGFVALYPLRQRILSANIEKNIGHHSQDIDKVCTTISQQLKRSDIDHEISNRRKNLYSIYRKMQKKHLHFSEVLDILAVRIILKNVDDCYRALGLIHNLYKPRFGYFKDYIALPKANGYQSLHTVLFGPHGTSLEVQMRTAEMNLVAEQGIAAHVLYKTDFAAQLAANRIKTKEWVKDIVDLGTQINSPLDFLENLKGGGFFADEVYVFTPEGNIISLPKGATALDFAFAVHTDLGLRSSVAIIDKQPSALSSELQNGQTVEVITASEICTHPGWLDFTITVKARVAIRNQLKHLHKQAALQLGQRLLDESLQALDTKLVAVDSRKMKALLKAQGLKRPADLYVEIGLGNQMPALMARRLLGEENRLWRKSGRSKSLAIKGTEGLAVTYSKCCYPIPGDKIVGIMNPGKGLVVHRHDCRNLSHDPRRKKMRILLEWSSTRLDTTEYHVAIRVRVQHKRGMLAVIADQIAKTNTNIENISIDKPAGTMAALTLVVSVKNRQHLDTVIDKIKNASRSIRVERVN